MSNHWPMYFWYVAYHPRLEERGRKYRERSGYTASLENALNRVTDNAASTNHVIGVGIQKQWGDHHDPPLLRWTRGMRTPAHLT